MTGPKLGKEGITYKENIFGSLMRMFREEGLSGFFKGNGTNVLRIAPYSAIQFLAFEYYKTVLNKKLIAANFLLVASRKSLLFVVADTRKFTLRRTRRCDGACHDISSRLNSYSSHYSNDRK